MPSTSFEKPSTVQHHYSLYETVGEISVADPNRDPLVIQDSLVTDNLVQDSIQSTVQKGDILQVSVDVRVEDKVSVRNSYNRGTNQSQV